LVLQILNQGKHFTDEGKELIELIYRNMNSRRIHTIATSDNTISNLKARLRQPEKIDVSCLPEQDCKYLSEITKREDE
jgi:hypothetical protein